MVKSSKPMRPQYFGFRRGLSGELVPHVADLPFKPSTAHPLRRVAKLTPDNRKSDRENEIRYDLVWERGRWAIDDVHSVIEPNPWSLRGLLSQYLAR
jgi:hypothetical protein